MAHPGAAGGVQRTSVFRVAASGLAKPGLRRPPEAGSFAREPGGPVGELSGNAGDRMVGLVRADRPRAPPAPIPTGVGHRVASMQALEAAGGDTRRGRLSGSPLAGWGLGGGSVSPGPRNREVVASTGQALSRRAVRQDALQARPVTCGPNVCCAGPTGGV